MEEIDDIFRKMIINYMDNQYHIVNNQIIEIGTLRILYPNVFSEELVLDFDIHKDLSDHIIFNWLYENGFDNIMGCWNLWSTNSGLHATIGNYPAYQQTIDWDDDNANIAIGYSAFSSGTTNTTIVGGSGNITTSNNSIAIGNNSGGYGNISWTPTPPYVTSVHTANIEDSPSTLIQMNPDGTIEYITN